ncbi:MAG: 4'-phosphopantetheinyl transferase [Myxococcota bacterium]|jgi:4'-phosphopantetheinyl transferase
MSLPRCSWEAASTAVLPEPGEIALWAVPLVRSEAGLRQDLSVLTVAERERAERHVFARDRRRFAVGRASLRRILAGALGCRVAEIRLSAAARGKPYLPGHPCHFNLSNSGELALIAVSRTAVGVDVEQLRPLRDLRGLAASCFSLAEQHALDRQPEPIAGFFRIWTRKEAIIKAIGEGLSFPLKFFTVSAGSSAALLELIGTAHPPWLLSHEVPAVGYIGAVASPSQARVSRRLLWIHPALVS